MDNIFLVLMLVIFLNINSSDAEQEINTSTQKKSVKCIENGRFYRDPDRLEQQMWTVQECAKYFLCLDGEVFDFRCSSDLLFDVHRQICDFKLNVDNCDISTQPEVPPPLLEEANCKSDQLGCADGTCLPYNYFCDGSIDCLDGSDEAYCDPLNDPGAALVCNTSLCNLPNCWCSKHGTAIPGDLPVNDVPQMVLLTFDDAINEQNFNLYEEIFSRHKNWRNPNGCPIKATFFVSHQYNNYYFTQKLWNQGHEIAIHSITHRGPEDWWSLNATLEDYFDEMVGEANILHKYAKIRLEDLKGVRVPFLQTGWNRQFLMMHEFGFNYDNSIVAPPFSNPPLWPYTLDYRIPHDCSSQLCPTRSYPGLWEMIINPLEWLDSTCATIDGCGTDLTEDEVLKLLIYNFKRHYTTNRAPFGLHFHSSWFKNVKYWNAFKKFMSEILKHPDVWFVTNSQAIAWMRQPTSLSSLSDFQAWNSCNKRNVAPQEIACQTPNICKVYSRVFQEERYFITCTKCPSKYPWIRNEFGLD